MKSVSQKCDVLFKADLADLVCLLDIRDQSVLPFLRVSSVELLYMNFVNMAVTVKQGAQRCWGTGDTGAPICTDSSSVGLCVRLICSC